MQNQARSASRCIGSALARFESDRLQDFYVGGRERWHFQNVRAEDAAIALGTLREVGSFERGGAGGCG